MNGKIKPPRCSWRRPTGPLIVWKIIDTQVKSTNGTTQLIRFSIQEVPNHRKQETVEFMYKYFVRDEPINKSFDAANSPEMLDDLRLLWDYCLDQGMVVAAYTLNENNQIDELASVNMLYVTNDEVENDMEELMKHLQFFKFKKLMDIMCAISKAADPRVIYGVDKYISAVGLTVASKFRGQKLGLHMLEARNEIGKTYGIPATSTVFTAPASQILAERAGFEDKLTLDYAEIRDDEKNPFFPNIESKCMKVMMRRLC